MKILGHTVKNTQVFISFCAVLLLTAILFRLVTPTRHSIPDPQIPSSFGEIPSSVQVINHSPPLSIPDAVSLYTISKTPTAVQALLDMYKLKQTRPQLWQNAGKTISLQLNEKSAQYSFLDNSAEELDYGLLGVVDKQKGEQSARQLLSILGFDERQLKLSSEQTYFLAPGTYDYTKEDDRTKANLIEFSYQLSEEQQSFFADATSAHTVRILVDSEQKIRRASFSSSIFHLSSSGKSKPISPSEALTHLDDAEILSITKGNMGNIFLSDLKSLTVTNTSFRYQFSTVINLAFPVYVFSAEATDKSAKTFEIDFFIPALSIQR